MPTKITKSSGKKVTFSANPNPAQLDQWVNAATPIPTSAAPTSTTPTPIEAPPSAAPPSPTKPIETVKMKRLTLDISEDLHRSIKLKAVTQGVSMVDLLRDLLEQTYGKP